MKRRDFLAASAAGLFLPAAFGRLRPKVAIIMDDLGYRQRESFAAVSLPSAITLAILPHTSLSRTLAENAVASGHEVMLHLPMQAQNGKEMGEGGLSLDLTEAETRARIQAGFQSVTGAVGFNNHMGSAYSLDRTRLDWVMGEAAHHVGYFVDSLTVGASKAELAARAAGLKAARRDVFLDDASDVQGVEYRFNTLESTSERVQIAICHPRLETLAFLQEYWGWIEDHFEVVPASRAVV